MHSRTEKIDLNDISGSVKKLDFSNMDLRCKNFAGEDLEFADFEGADLYGADFSLANLRCANLKKAKIEQTVFYGADLRFADLSEANITYTCFQEANMEFANLTMSEIRDTDMSQVSMRHASLYCAKAERVNMAYSEIDHADFRGSRLKEISNPPFRAMACPSHGAFTGWIVGRYMRGKNSWLGAVVELQIPKDAIRLSNYNGICRTNKAIIKSIFTPCTGDYVDRFDYRDVKYEYVSDAIYYDPEQNDYLNLQVDDVLTSEIDLDRFVGKRGIKFYIDKDVARMEAYATSEP